MKIVLELFALLAVLFHFTLADVYTIAAEKVRAILPHRNFSTRYIPLHNTALAYTQIEIIDSQLAFTLPLDHTVKTQPQMTWVLDCCGIWRVIALNF